MNIYSARCCHHHLSRFIIFGLVALLVPAGLLSAGATLNQPEEAALACGAQALLWSRSGSGTVLLTIAVPAGSSDEPVAMAGLSHYLEHLLFDGFDELDERGVTEAFEAHSAYVNAFTREEATVFFALAPRTEAVAVARLLVGMLTRSKIAPATFDKEKKVILEELAKDLASPNGRKEQLLRSLLWADTGLGHPIGGTSASAEATTREAVWQYWQSRYGASNWRLLITGDLPLAGLAEVLDVFAALPPSPALPARSDSVTWPGWGLWQAAELPAGARPGGGRGMPPMGMGHRPMAGSGNTNGTLAVVLAIPDELAASATETQIVARWLAAAGGPLASQLVPGSADSLSVSQAPRQIRDHIEVRVEAASDAEPQDVLARVLGALAAAAAGPGDGEVMRIQRAWRAERALTGQRLHYAAVFYGEALAAARGPLAEALAPPTVTGEAVRKVARVLLAAAPGSIRAAWAGKGGPSQPSPLPAAIAPTTTAAASPLEPGPLGSLVSTLPNGLVAAFLTEPGSPVFGLHLLVADRGLAEPEESPGVADLIHRLLPAGTMLSPSSEFERRLERAGIEVKAADNPNIPFDNRYHVGDFSYLRIEGPATSLEPALAILAEMIRQPAWDSAGWAAAVADHKLAQAADNRGGAAAGAVFRGALLGPDHFLARAVAGPEGALASPDQVRAVWGNWPEGYFAPPRLILSLASPLPADEVAEIVATLFAGGPAAEPRRGPYPPPPTTEPTVPTPGPAAGPQITVLMGRLATVSSDEQAALLVAVDALSDRMVAVIREQEGLAYRLGAGVRVLPGGQWLVTATVGTRPENQSRVTALLGQLTQELAASPLDQPTLERLANRQRRSRMLRGLSAASRAYRLGRAIFEGPTSPLYCDATAYGAVTAEKVKQAARKYLVEEMLVVITP